MESDANYKYLYLSSLSSSKIESQPLVMPEVILGSDELYWYSFKFFKSFCMPGMNSSDEYSGSEEGQLGGFMPGPFGCFLRAPVPGLHVNSFLTSESTAPLSHMSVFLSKGGLRLKYRWACQHGPDDSFITCSVLQQHVVNDPSPHPTRELWWAPASRLHSQLSFWACSARSYYWRSWLLKIPILLHSSFYHDWY